MAHVQSSAAEMAFTDLPIVDLAAWHGSAQDRQDLADEVCAICHRVGFFLLVGHGVDEAFVDSVFAMMHELFALPTEQ